MNPQKTGDVSRKSPFLFLRFVIQNIIMNISSSCLSAFRDTKGFKVETAEKRHFTDEGFTSGAAFGRRYVI